MWLIIITWIINWINKDLSSHKLNNNYHMVWYNNSNNLLIQLTCLWTMVSYKLCRTINPWCNSNNSLNSFKSKIATYNSSILIKHQFNNITPHQCKLSFRTWISNSLNNDHQCQIWCNNLSSKSTLIKTLTHNQCRTQVVTICNNNQRISILRMVMRYLQSFSVNQDSSL